MKKSHLFAGVFFVAAMVLLVIVILVYSNQDAIPVNSRAKTPFYQYRFSVGGYDFVVRHTKLGNNWHVFGCPEAKKNFNLINDGREFWMEIEGHELSIATFKNEPEVPVSGGARKTRIAGKESWIDKCVSIDGEGPPVQYDFFCLVATKKRYYLFGLISQKETDFRLLEQVIKSFREIS